MVTLQYCMMTMSNMNEHVNEVGGQPICGGSGLCEHGRRRSRCKECGGSGICEHGRRKNECKDCRGSGICEHGRIKNECKECGVSGSKTINRGRKRKHDQSDSTDANKANISANEGRNFKIV